MRGTRSRWRSGCGLRGIIPADAGNTFDAGRVPVPSEDHPRGCGEHPRYFLGVEPELGSSPRMRGTQSIKRKILVTARIIPADAGNTPCSCLLSHSRQDHPRGCGEHQFYVFGHRFHPGSSPRMRGTRIRTNGPSRRRGIIPADAGNTASASVSIGIVRDHPRGCGEHLYGVRAMACSLGSSPRMRGTLSSKLMSMVSRRIIPADAGNTITTGYDPTLRRGSSPRMRGTREAQEHSWLLAGIIPADAGNTWRSFQALVAPEDHPRGCGEHPMA